NQRVNLGRNDLLIRTFLRADLTASSALEKPEHDFLNPRGSIQLNGFGAYAYKFIPPLSEIG
ncbi:hypothetical protein ACP3WH_24255, partial [Salmonella enterica]